ncbi:MAG: sulfite exporter TauE/SafE family protein [Pyrinomonadaceae bacterium]
MDVNSFGVAILLALFLVAILYSSVGHGGASGYLAVMALAALAPEGTRPTALVLNVFVASIGAIQFYRAGHFSWQLFWPFAIASIPAAFVGGMIQLPTNVYKWILGAVLILAAARLAWNLQGGAGDKQPPIWLAVIIGLLIGLLSGLVGVGGGIFLTPILLLANWSETKTAAGVSALFILVNSISGLAGSYAQVAKLPSDVWLWFAAALVGGIIGSTLGARRFNSLTIRRVLALVLVFAGMKLLFV